MVAMPESDVHPKLEQLAAELGEEVGMDAERVLATVEAQTGIDLATVEDEHAEEFVEAFEEQDEEKLADILAEYDVDQEQIDAFKETVMSAQQGNAGGGDSSDGSPASNGESAPSGGDGGVSRQEVEQMIQQSVPDADEIANSIAQRAGGGGGGGGQPAEGGGGGQAGGLDPGTQQILAQALSQHFLGGGGGGQMAQLGEEVQKEAMKGFIRDLRKPDFGDLLEAKFYEEALGSDVTDDIMADLIPSKEGEEEDQDMFEALMEPDEDDDADDDSDEGSTSRWGF